MKHITILILLTLFIISLSFRLNGIFDNHPFWVDEFSTVNQADLLKEHGLNVFTNNNIYFENNKITSAILAKIGLDMFGREESSARIPFAIIASFIPLLVYALAYKIGPKASAFPAALLVTTSYLMITWSRQARSYSPEVLLSLALFYIYFRIMESGFTRKLTIVYGIIAVLGIFTHPFFYLVLAAHFIHMLLQAMLTQKKHFLQKNSIYLVAIILGIAITIIYGTFGMALRAGIVSLSNNIWLYHAYLWREYTLITFLGFAGLFLGFLIKRDYFLPIIIFVLIHLIFINFFFATATTRYLLPIFPWLFIGVAYLFTVSSSAISEKYFRKNNKMVALIPLFLTLAIIVNGHRFDIKPNRFYSVNHDYREIALIDYDKIYDIVHRKGDLDKKETAVIDTWVDRAAWYVGPDYPALYNFRWTDAGIMKQTPFEHNDEGEKILWKRTSVRFITEVSDLNMAMEKYRKGFILIDDTSMPADVIQFAQEHLTEEIFLDRYPLDDNPLSSWPVTLYSWGTKE